MHECESTSLYLFPGLQHYNKVFDKGSQLLENNNLDMKEILNHLYYNQKAAMKEGNEFFVEIAIESGVRQGCVLSPILFNMYSDEIMQETLEDLRRGIEVSGTNNI